MQCKNEEYSTLVLIFRFTFENPSDPEYKRFLENISCDEEKSMANPETLLGEIEAKTRELIGTRYKQSMIIMSCKI